MQVYTFDISLINRDITLKRTISVLSNSTLAYLAYCILASVDANGSHLFNIIYKKNRFEFLYDNMDMFEPIIYYNPALYKLDELNLKINDKMTIEYDYGISWEFDIKLISIEEMKKGTHRHYPYIVKGIGKKLNEDNLEENIKDDLKEIDVKLYNYILKDEILSLKDGYETHLINTKKYKLLFDNISNYSLESNYNDWDLLIRILPIWQEEYIEKRIECYKCLLNKNTSPSKKFYDLYTLINKDKKNSAIMNLNIKRLNMINEIIKLVDEKTITIDDLKRFSNSLLEFAKRHLSNNNNK